MATKPTALVGYADGIMAEARRSPPLRIEMPLPIWVRIALIFGGLLFAGLVTWTLYRGGMPETWSTHYRLFVILGAYTVSITSVITGPMLVAATWTVERGHIMIEQSNWFRNRRNVFGARQIVRVEVTESDGDGQVELVTTSGDTFRTHGLGRKPNAEQLRDQIVRALSGSV